LSVCPRVCSVRVDFVERGDLVQLPDFERGEKIGGVKGLTSGKA